MKRFWATALGSARRASEESIVRRENGGTRDACSTLQTASNSLRRRWRGSPTFPRDSPPITAAKLKSGDLAPWTSTTTTVEGMSLL
jgi:hypothetical protein